MAGCAEVCIDMDYGESNEFHAACMRTARKGHSCCECNRTIEPGERYEYAAGKYDGHFFAEKTCAECAAIRDALVCGSYVYGQLWEAIEEEVFPVWDRTGPWDCLAKIDLLSARQALQECYKVYREEAGDG